MSDLGIRTNAKDVGGKRRGWMVAITMGPGFVQVLVSGIKGNYRRE